MVRLEERLWSFNMNQNELIEIAGCTRDDVLKMLSGKGHYGGALSCVEMMVYLYFKEMKENDKFVLSKSHASVTLYSILARKGLLDKKDLETYAKKGSKLGVCAESDLVPGVEFCTGSLGHGLPFCVGLALGNKLRKNDDRVFILMGDGECQEGSVWEAAIFAGHHKLNNLYAIIDYNKIQSSGRIEDIINLEPFSSKWKACNWNVVEIDGHSFECYEDVFTKSDGPTVIIAHTIKGKGVSSIEDKSNSHFCKIEV
jgi:transketolase